MHSNEIPPTPKPVNERIRKLKEELTGKIGAVECHNRILAFAMEIQKRHPDYNKYRAYHQLISSTPPENVIDGDFEGDDSVEKFFKSLLPE